MAGGGTGKDLDLDDFDTRSEAYYNQLIVWDPDASEIIGGYRFIKKKVIASEKYKDLATNSLFHLANILRPHIFHKQSNLEDHLFNLDILHQETEKVYFR